jgi:hypothetical protein
MSSVVIAGDVSGTVTLDAPSAAGSTVLTLPATSGTVLAPSGGTLGASQGGTGLTSVGTSGNVLTSNGTTWTSSALPSGGVTSLNGQTGAITNTALYAIGSYVNGRPKNNTGYAVDATLAGSSLWATSSGCMWDSANIDWQNQSQFSDNLAASSAVGTGTWRCVSPAPFVNLAFSGLWVRIS